MRLPKDFLLPPHNVRWYLMGFFPQKPLNCHSITTHPNPYPKAGSTLLKSFFTVICLIYS